MKDYKGFTLIELLAILVILAVIAVITTPIILGIIDDAKKNASVDSAYGFKDAIDKYRTTATMSNGDLKINGRYSVSNGVLDGPSVDNVEISISGIKPSSGYLVYSNSILQGGCLVVDEYQVIYSNGHFDTSGKGECQINANFVTDSWTTIKSNLLLDRNAYDNQIGAEKEILIDGTSYTVRLANTQSCPDDWPDAASQTTCGVVIEFVDIIIDTDNNNANGHSMNPSDTNDGGWPASGMYSFLNTTIFNKLPDELKADGMILNTKTVSGHGSQSGATNYTSLNDKLYLLSYVELSGSNASSDSVKLVEDGVTDGTRQLEYYANPESTMIKKLGGNGVTWWLRSANSLRTYFFLAIGSNGTLASSYSSVINGVAPAFRIFD